MKEHGLLFMGDMACAMVLGNKSVTRRIIAPHNSLIDGVGMRSWHRYGKPVWDWARVDYGPSPAGNAGPYLHLPFSDGTTHRIYPRISVGDTIWGKETWKYHGFSEDGKPLIEYAVDGMTQWCQPPEEWAERLTDIWAELSDPENFKRDTRASDPRWRPSMFMPRWASRIERQVQAICCQRANTLVEEEILQEGILKHTKDGDLWKFGLESWPWTEWELTAQDAWQKLWEMANGHENWLRRPWVWGYSLKQVGC